MVATLIRDVIAFAKSFSVTCIVDGDGGATFRNLRNMSCSSVPTVTRASLSIFSMLDSIFRNCTPSSFSPLNTSLVDGKEIGEVAIMVISCEVASHGFIASVSSRTCGSRP
eukprot:SAG31_NODE_691_length_12779_cov_19.035095_12_plen_111_part_00